MSELKKETIEELRNILRQEYGRDVDFQTASAMARNLVGFWDILAKIKHKEESNKYET